MVLHLSVISWHSDAFIQLLGLGSQMAVYEPFLHGPQNAFKCSVSKKKEVVCGPRKPIVEISDPMWPTSKNKWTTHTNIRDAQSKWHR